MCTRSITPHTLISSSSFCPCSHCVSTCITLDDFFTDKGRLSFPRRIVYYIPTSAIKVPIARTGYRIPCKWIGQATFYAITGNDGIVMANRIWSFEAPDPMYEPIRGCLSFFARPWQCYVDGERVVPQRLDLGGGWVTGEIEGAITNEHDSRF